MVDTHQFKLPLLQAAQAQKHVTVNEAFARLDALAQLRLMSISETVPPVGLADGAAYGVMTGAVNDWNLHGGEIAIFSNGGWVFVLPAVGWKAWVADVGKYAIFDGTDWRLDAVALSSGGAATIHKVTEIDHIISAGANSITVPVILNGEQVIGVTGRVLVAVNGTGVTGWKLGVSGSTNRYGSGLGVAMNSWVRGLSGTPVTYWSDTPLELTAEGGSFQSGTVRLAVHSVRLEMPNSV